MGNVFCGLLPRFDPRLQNKLALFWHETWEGGWDGVGAVVKRALRARLQNPQRRLQDASDVVQFFKGRDVISST
jgi:hypothetical protein